MDIQKNKHFKTAKKKDLLIPKHFCELVGLPVNYASHLKKYSVYHEDKKRIFVRQTIDYIMICNVFKRWDWRGIRSNFIAEKSKNKSNTEKKIRNKISEYEEKQERVLVNSYDERDLILSEKWREVLEEILDFSDKDQEIVDEIIAVITQNLKGPVNAQNIKYITEAYQKLQSIQKDRRILLRKDVVTFMVGTICEFMFMSCQKLIVKKLKQYDCSQSEIDDINQEFLDLLEFAKKEIKQLIEDKIEENTN